MIKISRKSLAEYFILTLYTHPSLQEVCKDDDLVVPVERYMDFLNDFGIIMGQLIRHVAKVEEDLEE